MTQETHNLTALKLPITASHFLAGAFAGTTADLLTYPLDSLATHAQSRSSASSFRALYRGFGVAAVLSAPAYASYFGVFDLAKRKNVHPAIAGCAAEVAAGFFFVPCEVLKKRAVLGRDGYTRLRDIPRTAVTLVRAEGVRALYAGYGASVATWMPFSALYFWTFEIARARILQDSNLRDFISGGLAGAVAAFVTSPVNLVATRVQTRYGGARSVVEAMGGIVREEGLGIRPFFRGAQARVVWLAPQAAVMLSVFELLKRLLDGKRNSFCAEP